MSVNLKDFSFSSNHPYPYHRESVNLKSILSGRKSAWRFAKRRKQVKFSESQVSKRSGRHTEVHEKWKKYVAEQFKTLRRNKLSKRSFVKNKKKRRTSTSRDDKDAARCSGRSGDGEDVAGPSGSGLGSGHSSDALQTFQLPEPDHKKRKKSGSGRSSPTKKMLINKTKSKSSRPKGNKIAERCLKAPAGTLEDGGDPSQDKTEEADQGYLKRPLNAFMIFSQSCRLEFKDLMNQSFDSSVISMVLGHVWRFLSKQERISFYEEAEKQREHYYEQKKTTQSEGMNPKEGLKKPLNAFLLFCQDQRSELSRTTALSGRRSARNLARKWKRLPPNEKQIYRNRAEQELSSYKEKKNLEAMKAKDTQLPLLNGNITDNCTGDGARVSAVCALVKKLGKNNNKWPTDSSDTDGSQANSATQVKPLKASSATDASSSEAATQPERSISEATDEHAIPQTTMVDVAGDESDEELEMPSSSRQVQVDSSLAQSTNSPYSEAGRSSSDNDNYRRGKRHTKKSRRKVRRHGSKKRVHWNDAQSRWDNFDKVASVLCDEDICSRLVQARGSKDDSRLPPISGDQYLLPSWNRYLLSDKYAVRKSNSSLVLSSGKNHVKAAFLASELDLANYSSSSCSDPDSCTSVDFPDLLPSSSDESCLFPQISAFISDSHEAPRSSTSSNTHTLSSLLQKCAMNPSSSENSPAEMFGCYPQKSKSAEIDHKITHSRGHSVSSGESQQNSTITEVAAQVSHSSQTSDLSSTNESCCTNSTVPQDSNSNAEIKEKSFRKGFCSSENLYPNSFAIQEECSAIAEHYRQNHDKNIDLQHIQGMSITKSECKADTIKESDLAEKVHSSKIRIPSFKPMGNQQALINLSDKRVSNHQQAALKKWSTTVKRGMAMYSPLSLNTSSSFNTERMQKQDYSSFNSQSSLPHAYNSYSLPLMMSDSFNGFQQHKKSPSHHVSRLSLLELSSCLYPTDKSEPSVNRIDKEGSKRHLKRKSSHSLEHSVDNLTDMIHSACSWPKYAFVDLTLSRGARGRFPKRSENDLTNSQVFGRSESLFGISIPSDLELEFCAKKGWIY